jgi:hypothetical protein
MAGPRKFSANPLLANSAPSTALEAASKGYVDSVAGKLGGWVDCSAMTTASAINAAADPAVCGTNATIWLGPNTKTIDATLIVYPGQTWLGGGGRETHTILSAGASLGAGLPIMASAGWYNNGASADAGVLIRGILFDLNGRTNRHGLIIYNYWSWVDDCQFTGHSGTGIAGLHPTDKARNGTTISSNSHSENRYTACRFDNGLLGAMGIWSETNNGISNQDAHLSDCFFSGQTGYAVKVDRAAGWTIENNHLYGCGDNAFDLTNCYATKVIGNYIEDYGQNNVTTGPTGGYYSGINMATILDGKPSICALNTIEQKSPTTPAYNSSRGITARAGSGQNDARLVLIGNTISLAGSATVTEGLHLGEGADTGRTLNLMMAGNQLDPWGSFATPVNKANTTVRIKKDYTPVRAYTGVTGTITLDNEFEMVQNFTCTGDVTANLPGSNVNARDGEPMQLRFLASGAQRIITLNASAALSTGITSRAFTVPSGKVLFLALEWSSLLTAYVITAATIST